MGQSPTLKAKPSLAAEAAPLERSDPLAAIAALNAPTALKGYGGKQEISPGLFLLSLEKHLLPQNQLFRHTKAVTC